MKLGLLLGLLSLLLLPGSPALAAKIYKWTDAQGRVHYSATPPRDAEYQNLATPPPPKHDPQAALRELRDKAGLGGTMQDSRSGGDGRSPSGGPREERRAEACRRARKNLETLHNYRQVTRLDEQGEQVPISDEERATVVQQTEKEIDFYCKP